MNGTLYEALGEDRVRATPLTRGPWDPGAQHGGAPAALLGGAIEAAEPGADMRVVRVTLELLRPVPVGELRVETEIVRPGRCVQLVAGRLWAGEQLVVQALALRLRRAGGVAPAIASADAVGEPPGAEAAQRLAIGDGEGSFADGGVELRFVRGDYREPGPAAVWIALRAAVLAGQQPSALQRVLAAADFGNGVSAVLDWDRHLFINPDLTVHLERDAVGEWIALDAETTIAADGTGQARSVLYDAQGRIGHAIQSLYVDARR